MTGVGEGRPQGKPERPGSNDGNSLHLTALARQHVNRGPNAQPASRG